MITVRFNVGVRCPAEEFIIKIFSSQISSTTCDIILLVGNHLPIDMRSKRANMLFDQNPNNIKQCSLK